MNVQKGSDIVKEIVSEFKIYNSDFNLEGLLLKFLKDKFLVDEVELREMKQLPFSHSKWNGINTRIDLIKEILGDEDRVKVIKKFEKKPISSDESKW